MKKKFLILTLCFTLVFTSINYKKSYAVDLVVSPTVLATVGTLAVASGVLINSNEGLYDVVRDFREYYKDSWDNVLVTLREGAINTGNGIVEFSKDVVACFKDFMLNAYKKNTGLFWIDMLSANPDNPSIFTIPTLKLPTSSKPKVMYSLMNGHGNAPFSLRCSYTTSGYNVYYSIGDDVWYQNLFPQTGISQTKYLSINGLRMYYNSAKSTVYYYPMYSTDTSDNYTWSSSFDFTIDEYRNWNKQYLDAIGGLTYNPGAYDDTSLENDKSIALPVPGDLSDLVGANKDTVFNGDYSSGVIGSGGVSVPSIDNPPFGLEGDIVFPGDIVVPDNPSIPNDTPFANITEYIIGLVVPSDSYWTDTFGGLYNNFTNSFPMVDMDNFNNLVTGEKKFPNIDVNIMGVKGRVVNGDVINSIVDWLRPIIAGFMMLCLMLFNYRKIYKTIRGIEPFQGIAQGTSDFRTGISEYNYMGTGLSKSDYEANQMELAKALYDYEQDTGKTYKIKI